MTNYLANIPVEFHEGVGFISAHPLPEAMHDAVIAEASNLGMLAGRFQGTNRIAFQPESDGADLQQFAAAMRGRFCQPSA